MFILLDLDGVLITTPAWRAVDLQADGFFAFNAKATANLASILAETQAALVLTTSHRINYSLAQWQSFLQTRGIMAAAISKVNERTTLPPPGSRAAELTAWVAQHGATANYVILDDDLLLHTLPPAIKERCVITKPLLGLDSAATQQALHILRSITPKA